MSREDIVIVDDGTALIKRKTLWERFLDWLDEILNPDFVFQDEGSGLYCRENIGEWTTSLSRAYKHKGETEALQIAGRLSSKLGSKIVAVRVPK